jgi:hypothetical protein
LASAALLACAALAIALTALADLAGAETALRPYAVIGDAIPASLTGAKGDPERGRAKGTENRHHDRTSSLSQPCGDLSKDTSG